MANIVMNPALVIQGTPSPLAVDKLVTIGPQGSFAAHLDRKVAAVAQEASNKLGLSPSAAPTGAEAVKSAMLRPGQKKADDPSATPSIVDLLQQVMQQIKVQSKDVKQGPGEWTFSAVETPALGKLAAKAGMNETETSWLLQQANTPGGKVKVADFFATLQQYFTRLAKADPITVPETDLPLVETFLGKMGLPVEDSNRIAKSAVTGGGNLDLGKLLQGLQATQPATVEGLTPITLTPWEGEQLQLMLAKAGLPRSYQESLLADASLNLSGAAAGTTPAESALLTSARQGATELSYSGLCSMLDTRLQELKGSRTVADLPGFLGEMKQVLTQTGFDEKTVGWAPVVQNSAQAVYEESQEIVDAAKAKLDKSAAQSAKTTGLMATWPGAGQADSTSPQTRPVADLQGAAGLVGDSRLIPVSMQKVVSLDSVRLQTLLVDRLQELKVNQVLAEQQGVAPAAAQIPIPAVAPEMSMIQGLVGQELPSGMIGQTEKDLTAQLSAAGKNDVPLTSSSKGDGVAPVVPAGLNGGPASRGESMPPPFVARDNRNVTPIAGVEAGQEGLAPAAKNDVAASAVLPRAVPAEQPILTAAVAGEKILTPVPLARELQNGVASQRAKAVAASDSGAGQDDGVLAPAAKSEAATPTAPAGFSDGKGNGEGTQASWSEEQRLAAGKKGQPGSAGFAQVGHELAGDGKGLPASAGMAVGNLVPGATDTAVPGVTPPLSARQPSEFETQVMNQLSEGVARGLKNDDHHLVLTMYPKDLGEVKVEMKVQDHQVAVSFVMENSKVKEVLESNLGQFKDNLQKQGYALGEFSVTVNRDDGGNDARQRFEYAWQEQMRGSKSRSSAPGEELLYRPVSSERARSREGNINLVI